ncbi:PAS domain-containing protein [bacterium]|nr:PAS domain-containing protein [bacterium]
MKPELPDLEHLLGSVAEGITVSDPRQPDMPLIYANAGFLKMTGYSEAEVLGRNCRFLQGPGSSRAAAQLIRSAIENRLPLVTEILNYRKDGTAFWNQLSLTPVLAADGSLKYYVGVQLDVSQRKQLEQMQRDFLDNAAHEFKTPLTIITGVAETLQRQPHLDEATRRSLLERLHWQAQRLSSLVSGLLELSAAEALAERSFSPVLLQSCACEALRLAAPLAELARVRLTEQLESEPLQVYGDRPALLGLLGNLLSNAVRHSPEGGEVQLRLRRDADSAVLAVRDSGPGIAQDQLERIFERFYSVDRSRSSSAGSGLGLAIVRRVADAHGGHVHVESRPGQGSTFSVRLPLI